MENDTRSLDHNSELANARQGVHDRKGCKCAWEVQMTKLADGAEVGGSSDRGLSSSVSMATVREFSRETRAPYDAIP